MPINYDDYPENWKEIRAAILERSKGDDGVVKCEWCGVPNYAYGQRDKDGIWRDMADIVDTQSDIVDSWFDGIKERYIKIVLTIAHVNDPDPMNCDPDNLAALCQRCHLNHDRDHHVENRRRNARNRQIEEQKQHDSEIGQLRMFD